MSDEVTLPPSNSFAARSHVGARDNNEDRVFADESLGLFLVADGVGGHLAGEVASRISCDVVAQCVRSGTTLEAAIRSANTAVHEAVRTGDGRDGMASTMVAALQRGDSLQIAWVGDSRAYLWDGSSLALLTRDHSLVEAMVERGEITAEEASTHPQRNVILQALGQSDDDSLDVSVRILKRLPEGAVVLLCSDGLSDVVSVPALVSLLRENSGLPGDLADDLIEAALAAEGRDNISVLVFNPACPGADRKPLVSEDIVWSYQWESGEYTYGPVGPSAVEPELSPASAVEVQVGGRSRNLWLLLAFAAVAAVTALGVLAALPGTS